MTFFLEVQICTIKCAIERQILTPEKILLHPGREPWPLVWRAEVFIVKPHGNDLSINTLYQVIERTSVNPYIII